MSVDEFFSGGSPPEPGGMSSDSDHQEVPLHGSRKRMTTPMDDEPSHWWVRVRMRTVYGPEPPLLREPPVAVTFGVDREITYHLWADTTPEQLQPSGKPFLAWPE